MTKGAENGGNLLGTKGALVWDMVSPKPLTPSERRKRWLKRLASEKAASWHFAVLHPLLDGRTRLETARETIVLEDGVCVAWMPHDPTTTSVARGQSLIGTRVVGWVTNEGMYVESPFQGGRAVLFRGGIGDETTLALAAPMRTFTPIVPLTTLTGPTKIVGGGQSRRSSVTLRSADESVVKAPRSARTMAEGIKKAV